MSGIEPLVHNWPGCLIKRALYSKPLTSRPSDGKQKARWLKSNIADIDNKIPNKTVRRFAGLAD